MSSEIDWRGALLRAGGDRQLLSELVELMPDESAGHIAGIKRAIETEDEALLIRSAHALRNVVTFFGVASLESLASTIEQMGHQGNFAGAAAGLSELERQTDLLVTALAQEQALGLDATDPPS